MIAKHHAAMLAASGIPLEHAEARGYETITSPQRLADIKIVRAARGNVPGLLVPQLRADGSTWGWQYRPDSPRLREGRPVKYETPWGQRNGLDVPPGVGDYLHDPSVPLWVTEGVKKADCGAQHQLCIVALSGVWNWRGTNDMGGKTAIADWNDVALSGRRVILAFDGDVARKVSAAKALCALADYLRYRQASVEYLHLPDEDEKVGLDDYLTDGNTADDLWALVRPDQPPIRNHDDDPAPRHDNANDAMSRDRTNIVLAGHKHWPNNDDFSSCAERVFAEMAAAATPLRHWRDQWYQFAQSNGYVGISDDDLRALLRKLTQNAKYVGAGGADLKWKPNISRLRELAAAMKDSDTAKLSNDVVPPYRIVGPALDGDEVYFPVRNGLLRLHGRVLMAHDPDLFSPNSLPIAYNADAKAPMFQDFMDSSFPGEARQTLALQFLGFYVSGLKYPQKMLIITGPTRSGKGTYVRILEMLLGEAKTKALDPKSLAYTFGLEGLEKAMVGVFDDIRQLSAEDKRRLVEFILNVVGGGKIPHARKNKSEWNDRVPARLLYIGNAWPPLEDNANALAARFEHLDTPNSYPVGEGNKDYEPLLKPEANGIFNRALDGLDSLLETGQFQRVETSESARDHARTGGPMMQFVDEQCECETDGGAADSYFVVGEKFRCAAKGWAARHGYTRHQDFVSEAGILNALQMVVTAKGVTNFRRGQSRLGSDRKPVRGYFGIRLKTRAQQVG